jgi:hypothetical protein
MDKVTKYQEIICKILGEYASIKKTITPDIKSYLIIDKESHNYQLIAIGWHNNKYVYTVAFHFTIINEKLWIQQNNTDALIADELCALGVEKNDIILGFIPAARRHYTGFGIS